MARILNTTCANCHTVQCASEYTCDGCRQRQRLQAPSCLSAAFGNTTTSAMVLSWTILGSKVQSPDRGVWKHARVGLQKYMVMIEIPKTSTKCCVKVMECHWFRVFGKPRTLKFDEMTVFTSGEFKKWPSLFALELDVAPGEAHGRRNFEIVCG